jgi:maltoporin
MFAGKAMEFVLLTRPVARPLLQEVNDRFATGEASVKGMNDLQGALGAQSWGGRRFAQRQ